MKKSFLLGAALLSTMCVMAQEGTDITPASYHFNTATEIPMYNVFLDNVNIKAGSTNVFGEMGFAEFYQDGLWVLTSAGQNADQQDAFRASWQLVNLGGDVGQVACFAGKASGIVEKLNELAPEMSENWSKIIVDQEATAGWQMHWWMDPDKCPTGSQGYIHCRMEYNIYSPNAGQNRKVFQNIGISTNANSLIGWNESANLSFLESGCILRYEDGEPELDQNEQTIWDPHTWQVYEFDFKIPDADDSGQIYIPARVRINAMNGNVWNDYAFFFKELSFTFIEGGSIGDVSFANPTQSVKTYDRVLVADGSGVNAVNNNKAVYQVNGNNVSFSSVAEVYNMTGQKVAKGENVVLAKGIYVAKVEGKTVKFIIL